jgi:hypothetical protein
MRYSWIVSLLLLLVSGAALADDFNPANPPDPQRPPEPVTPPTLYQVTVSTNAGQYASGGGKYEEGKSVYINTSASATGFEFKYWTKNGEQYSTNKSFYYTMEAADVSFVAVYVFNPTNPVNPVVPEDKPLPPQTYRLTLEANPTGVCSFNIASGQAYTEGQQIYLKASTGQGFVFLGWYNGETKVSSTQSFYFTMPAVNTTLQARYVFDPDNPANPSEPEPEAPDPEIDNTERYTLTFIVDGVVLQQEELREGTPIEAPEAPAKAGYQFEGWEPTVPATMPAEDVTLTAVYSSLYATITIGAAGEATYSDSRDLDFTNVSGLKAYIASGYSPSEGEATMTSVKKVPAGEGLYLRGEPGSYEVPYGKSDYIYANLLVGVPTATIVSPTEGEYTNFILTYDEVDGIGFYPMDSTGEIGPNKAYLQLPTSALPAASRRIILIFDDEEDVTGISATLNDKSKMINDKAVYDLQGRCVAKPVRGLYIKGGKKFINK